MGKTYVKSWEKRTSNIERSTSNFELGKLKNDAERLSIRSHGDRGNKNNIYLLKRNSQEALELAKRFEKSVYELKGVYAVEDDLKEWLKEKLDVD